MGEVCVPPPGPNLAVPALPAGVQRALQPHPPHAGAHGGQAVRLQGVREGLPPGQHPVPAQNHPHAGRWGAAGPRGGRLPLPPNPLHPSPQPPNGPLAPRCRRNPTSATSAGRRSTGAPRSTPTSASTPATSPSSASSAARASTRKVSRAEPSRAGPGRGRASRRGTAGEPRGVAGGGDRPVGSLWAPRVLQREGFALPARLPELPSRARPLSRGMSVASLLRPAHTSDGSCPPCRPPFAQL